MHRARMEVHIRRLARHRHERALALDAVAQVEQLAARANSSQGIRPFQTPLLAEDVEALELLVHLDLLAHFALLFGDARQPLAVLRSLDLRRRELLARLALRLAGDCD